MQKKWLLPIIISGLAFSLLVPGFAGCDGTTAANTQENNRPPCDCRTVTDTQKNSSPLNTTLDGSHWKLVSMNGNPPIKGSYISLRFHNGEAGGFAGGSGSSFRGGSLYGATYSLQAPDTLIVSECYLAGAGSLSEDMQRQEHAYFNTFKGVISYHFENDHLVIVNAGQLVFERLPEYQDPSALVGTKWRLVCLNDEPVLEELSITLNFDSKSQASGQAGPFTYDLNFKDKSENVGALEWGDLQITGGTDNLTLQNISPAEFQALRYIDCMHMSDNYRLTGDTLEIFTTTGYTLIYKPLTDSSNDRR